VPRRYWIETLGCPKNQVDSEKLVGTLHADGFEAAADPGQADLVVVNTCAFIDEARQESIDVILSLSDARKQGAEVVVTGCLAERHGDELAAALPEVVVRGFNRSLVGHGHGHGHDHDHGHGHDHGAGGAVAVPATPVAIGRKPSVRVPDFDLLNLPRPRSARPWAYVKIAEGCDRACGFCAIPSFRGPQRSRSIDAIVQEVHDLQVQEVVLVAQDLASYGRDQGRGTKAIVPLVREVAAVVPRVRLLYLYPSELTDTLVDTICGTGVPYFDLSLQHVSAPHLRRMKRWGKGAAFLERIHAIRHREPEAAFRSNFIVGYPGETEEDHDELLAFVEEARLDWCGFFAYSEEAGTYAATRTDHVDQGLVADRLAELRELQDEITQEKRDELLGREVEVLVDEPGVGRSHREAPEIDGVIGLPAHLAPGTFARVRVVGALGPDLQAEEIG
jgi:ribosomal protein S12 methylthiotransferase